MMREIFCFCMLGLGAFLCPNCPSRVATHVQSKDPYHAMVISLPGISKVGDNDGATELAMGKIGQPLVDPLLVWKDKERRGPNEVMVILQKSHLNFIRT